MWMLQRSFNHMSSYVIQLWCSSHPVTLMLLLLFLLFLSNVVVLASCFSGTCILAATTTTITSRTCVFLSGSGIIIHYPQEHKSSHHCILSMKIRVAIVGLPNVGKSTLFNTLAQKSIAQAENFPFCTIEPNRVPIAMPDKYLSSLGKLAKSLKTIPAYIELVDVAGLVAGASRGEGLGNQFLATVRECDVICHVIRCFEDANIIHVSGRVSPAQDAEVVNLELILADTAHIERRLEKITCQNEERNTLEMLLPELHKGIPARAVVRGLSAAAAPEFCSSIKSMGLLTLKPVIYVFNVDEVDFLFDKEKIMTDAKRIFDSIQYCDASRDVFTIVSAELASMLTTNNVSGGGGNGSVDGTTREYLKLVGFDAIAQDGDEQALDNVMGYTILPNMIRQVLDLFVIYVGPGVAPERSRTTRAFLINKSQSKLTTAAWLAGQLHGDIQKGFIRAEVTPACKLLEFSSYTAAKDAGVVRTEGKDYVLQKDDVVLIKWK